MWRFWLIITVLLTINECVRSREFPSIGVSGISGLDSRTLSLLSGDERHVRGSFCEGNTHWRGSASSHVQAIDNNVLPGGDNAPRLAIVACITDRYDVPPQINGPVPHNVDFFLFTDETDPRMLDNIAPWHPLPIFSPFLDSEVSVNKKNSLVYRNGTLTPQSQKYFSNAKRITEVANFISKYHRLLAWRIQQLRNHRFILYIDGNVEVCYANWTVVYDILIPLLLRWPMVHNASPKRSSIVSEALAADSQSRYHVDDVIGQARHYTEDLGYPDSNTVRWTGLFAYDAWSIEARQTSLCWFAEIQTWGLECQVSLPFSLWATNNSGRALLLKNGEFCNLLGAGSKVKCGGKHKKWFNVRNSSTNCDIHKEAPKMTLEQMDYLRRMAKGSPKLSNFHKVRRSTLSHPQ